jgi:hypothetical protein
MSKPLAVWTHTFRDIIEGGFHYIDKTRYIYELIRYPKGVYFLARPRRFGKSLLISTFEEIFQGNRALFQGLWLDQSDYDWQKYAVVRFDFSEHRVKDAETLSKVIDWFIAKRAKTADITLDGFDYQSNLSSLIEKLAQKQKVVILIDEYDKPITDNLTNLPEARRIREVLRDFYTVIKALDRHLRFVFITGISKFSRVGLFSTMNNLEDLTLLPQSATMLGITEEELRHDFPAYLAAFAQQRGTSADEVLAEIKRWYNGFCFAADAPNVYNPYSTLLCLKQQRFSNFWFETGTPNFLIDLIRQEQYDVRDLEQLYVRELGFSTYELDRLPVVPLLFQTGYLTLKDYEPDTQRYTLGYPNAEVEQAFMTYLLASFSDVDRSLGDNYLWQLLDALEVVDLDRFFLILQTFFANIDYGLYIQQEKYYQTIFYLIFMLLGFRAQAEVQTNQGRVDAVVELSNHIFLFEFKLDGSEEDALQQVKDRTYYQKYQLRGKPMTLIGANFSSTERQVVKWKHETLGIK